MATDDPRRAMRIRRDLMTNPAWRWVQDDLRVMLGKEERKLKSTSRGSDITAVNRQGGVCEGIEMVLMRLENMKTEVEQTMKEGDGSGTG